MTFKLLLRYAYRVLRISVIFKMKMHYNESVRKSVYKTKNSWTTCENGNHLLQCGQTITFEKTTFALWINCHVCCTFILMTCLYDMKNSKASKLDPWPKHPFHQPIFSWNRRFPLTKTKHFFRWGRETSRPISRRDVACVIQGILLDMLSFILTHFFFCLYRWSSF